MVKNLPSVERSTQIRFGRNVPDATEQAENTVIFNASNDTVPTPYSNAVYLSPIRNRTDYQAPEIVLLMYDRNTKEITESGESANALIGGSTLDTVVNRNNATSNTVQFVGPLNDVSFVTSANVGLSNLLPQHTVSVGSNLYIDDVGSNVLVVSGNVAVLKDMIIEGNLRVNGDTTVIYTENTSIKDALIELGKNNTSSDTTLDLGILMHRPDALSNVVIGYREGTDEFALAYTDAKPTDKTFTPKTDEDINVHVYGLTHVDANIYAHEDVLVTGNVYVSTNVSITEELTISNNVYADKDLEVMGNVYVDGNVVAYKDFTLTGNAYVSGNVSITEELTVSNNVYADKDLEVMGNTYVDGNVVAYKDFTLTGNAYVSGNVNITNQLTVSDNAYVTGNVQITEALIVSGNTHLEGDNVFITHTMDFLDPTTAIVTDQISNVQIRLGQLENVSNLASNPIENEVLMYDGNQWMNTFPNHSFLTIKNAETTATMTSGNAVYISGYQNENLALVKLAKADSTATMPAIGVVYGDDIAPAAEGLAVAYGKVNQMNTNGYQVGQTLYVSNVYAGYLTTVKPRDDQDANPDLIQNVGVVTRQDPNHGAMFVTGIGRANDIPNAELITDYNDMQYVYVNNQNNDLKKITSANLNIPLTTAVSSSSNSAANAVTLRGLSITSGDGFHGDITVAGNVTIDSTTLHVDAETSRVGVGTTRPGQLIDVRGAANVGVLTTTSGTVTDATHSTSKDTGVLVVTQGGLGVEANIHSTNVFAARHIAVGTSATTYALDVRGTSNVGVLTTPDITVTDGTDATNKTTGALNVSGGVGIAKQLHAADTTVDSVKLLNMSTGTIPYTDATKKLVDSLITQESDGTILISANVEIAGNISVLGNSFAITSNDLIISDRIIDIANNNASHELDVGILMEHPGYNIGIIHHGTHPHHLSIGYTSNGYAEDHVEWNVPNHITANVWGHLITQNTVTIEHNDMYIVNGGLGIGIGQRYDDNVPDSKLYVTGNAHVTSNLYVGGSDTTANLFVDTTRRQVGIMTSSPEATLHVTGNAYVSSNLSVNSGDLYVDTVTSRVGVLTQSPSHTFDVRGAANVGTLTTTSGTVTDTTDATSTTTGALQVQGGLGVSKSIHAVTIRGTDLSGTSLYGTLTGSNTAAVSDLTASGTVKGATLTGTNLYGTLSGSNTAAVSDLTASGTVKGATLTGTNLYGTISGSNTAAVSDLTASGTVRGATLTGTNLYGTLSGSNTAAVSDLTATGTIRGATLTGTNIYGPIVGSNAAAVTDITATGTISGATITGTELYGPIEGSNTASVSILTVSGTTEATDTITGALKVTGGISTQSNVHAANVYISGGLITNTSEVRKKTYAYAGDLGAVSIDESTIKINFTNHVFYAKIVAHLAEGTGEDISTIAFECGGGKWDGTAPSNSIAVGPVSVFGVSTANPWNSSVTTTATSVSFKPSEAMASTGNYNVFIEYICQSSSGRVSSIEEGTGGAVITYNY